MTKITSTRVSD